MEMEITVDGVEFYIVLEDDAQQKNAIGYLSISETVANKFGFSADSISENASNDVFMQYIKVRNIVISDLWGWK